MMSPESVREFQTHWLPNMTHGAIARLIDLLEKGSPLLIHGSFTRALPMGCLATHIAWNHPQTEHLTLDAGICWLNRIAHLNPATSHVIREWDGIAANDFEFRQHLLQILKEHQFTSEQKPSAHNRIYELVNT